MTKETIVAGILSILLIFFALGGADTLSHFMLMWLCIVFIIIFCFGVAMFLKEKPRDEREEAHFIKADRTAYILGTICIALYIAWQGIWTNVDPTLSAILAGVIIVRITVLLRSQREN